MSDRQRIQVQEFVDRFAPDDTQVPSGAFLQYAEAKVDPALSQLWQVHGLGFYGEQRIAVVDPGRWMPVLTTWLGREVATVPFAVTSFGHVYHAAPGGPVECLDPHFVTNTVISPDIVSFFNEHLPSGGSHLSDLEGPRGGGRSMFGPLETDEIYSFEPPIALGGQVRPETLTKVNGPSELQRIHSELRLRRAG